MKIRFPLYAKILFWFFLNMIFLGAVFLVVARVEFRFGLDSLISGPAGARLQSVTQLITQELRGQTPANWNDILKRFGDAYGVQFFLFRNSEQLAGAPVSLPQIVRDRMPAGRGAGPPGLGQDPGRPPFSGPPLDEAGPPPRENEHLPPLMEPRKFMVQTASPRRYWVITRVIVPDPNPGPRPVPLELLAVSSSLSGGGLFFDLRSWVVTAVAVVFISVLFWFPLVRGITGAISRMTLATEKIAQGRFEVRTQVKRQDELGSLSDAINRLAMRLSGFVAGQKSFLGDIAHELCSPIARIQVALGILEQRADEKQKIYLNDLGEEVEQMTHLVNELLSFSKASLGGTALKLQSVSVGSVVQKAVARECAGGEIKINITNDLNAIADPELLLRAIANILRNAMRYAASSGPITISAQRDGVALILSVEDCGPGVPETALARIFDPFYRVDTSRDRETGGVGLGLSIVKTCVESCGGTVRCENRELRGLRVLVRLSADTA